MTSLLTASKSLIWGQDHFTTSDAARYYNTQSKLSRCSMLLDGGSAKNDTHTPASELTDRSDLPPCSRNKSNFCLKEKNRAHYSQQTAMSFKDKTKQLLFTTHSRQSFFSGKTVPSAQWLFFLLANLVSGGESKRWDHCWQVLEIAKPPPTPLSGYQGGS